MKNSRSIRSFFIGFLVAVLIMSFAGTALAVSGLISYNTIGLRVGLDTVFEAGEYLNTESGAKVPSVVLYTDENGGRTHYVPIREIADRLNLPLELKQINGKECIDVQPTERAPSGGIIYNGELQELVVPIAVQSVKKLDSIKLSTNDAYEDIIEFDPDNGKLISVSVENTGNDTLQFHFGISRDKELKSTTVTTVPVPAGETVTRTLEVISEDGSITLYPYFRVDYPEGVAERIVANVSITQLEN